MAITRKQWGRVTYTIMIKAFIENEDGTITKGIEEVTYPEVKDNLERLLHKVEINKGKESVCGAVEYNQMEYMDISVWDNNCYTEAPPTRREMSLEELMERVNKSKSPK